LCIDVLEMIFLLAFYPHCGVPTDSRQA